jgi:hypothetical protein
MAVRNLDKANWHTFFDFLAKLHRGKQAEVEVASLALGVQVEAGVAAPIGSRLRSKR